MSDGNYNRNLLPYHQYTSGLKAGRAQMRTIALRAFSKWMAGQGCTPDEMAGHLARFRQLLDEPQKTGKQTLRDLCETQSASFSL